MQDFGFVFAGFFVGLVVGLTGVGGGSLMTPILIFFFGVKPYMAVGTDLLFAAFTKAGGTFSLRVNASCLGVSSFPCALAVSLRLGPHFGCCTTLARLTLPCKR